MGPLAHDAQGDQVAPRRSLRTTPATSLHTDDAAGRVAPRDPSAGGGEADERLAALVVAARDGDRSAFDQLVRLTAADTYGLAQRLVGNEEDARDVVQEAYLRAFRGIRQFRGDARFSTWLHRITANCASSHLGRRARHRHAPLDDDHGVVDDHPSRSPELVAEAGALRDRLTAELADLPPRLRAVVVLRDVYDLPHEAIAAELGISVTAAKVRLHRARKHLRERLFPLPGEEGPAPRAV